MAEFAWTRIKLFGFQFFKFVSDEDDSLDYGDIGENGDKPDGQNQKYVFGFGDRSQDRSDGQVGHPFGSLHQSNFAFYAQTFCPGTSVTYHERAGDG